MVSISLALALVGQGPNLRPYPLLVGDPAPKLEVSKWVQGTPVPSFKAGQVYVIDFWSTWCGPCKDSMPRLSQMQSEYGEKVVFIGVDVWDYQERVAPFVAEMGAKLTYRIALDTLPPIPKNEGNIPMWAKDNGKCAQSWLAASGADGIPTIFLVDGAGKIAWIGHDLNELQSATDRVLAGTWDLPTQAERHRERMDRKVKAATYRTQMFANMGRKHWEEALKFLELLQGTGESASPAATFEILTYMGKKAEALRQAEESLKGDDPYLLHDMAQLMVFTLEMRTPADLDIAHRLASKSNELLKGERGATLEILARIAWFKGDKAQAASLQRAAIAKLKSPIAIDRANRRLKDYEHA